MEIVLLEFKNRSFVKKQMSMLYYIYFDKKDQND